MENKHGDIKIISPDGKIKEVVPIDEAMERTYKASKTKKSFSGGNALKLAKDLKTLEDLGEIYPKDFK